MNASKEALYLIEGLLECFEAVEAEDVKAKNEAFELVYKLLSQAKA